MKTKCPHCGLRIRVPPAVEGKQGACPGCKKTFRLPVTEQRIAGPSPLVDERLYVKTPKGQPLPPVAPIRGTVVDDSNKKLRRQLGCLNSMVFVIAIPFIVSLLVVIAIAVLFVMGLWVVFSVENG